MEAAVSDFKLTVRGCLVGLLLKYEIGDYNTMSKALFNTPRSLGTVEEILIRDIRLHLNKEDGFYEISANFEEGIDSGGTFDAGERTQFRLLENDLNPADKVFVDSFLKMILTKYIGSKGYSNVTIP